jgi:uncharacterized protein (TIGR02145 family)
MIKKPFFILVALLVAASTAAAQGTLVDKRDGKEYQTVQIGKRTWMAENLNYEVQGSYCYDNDETNCSKYGRLYEWAVAKKACPVGWHLPSHAEFNTLLESVGGEQVAGKTLKSEEGWSDDGDGSDDFGFSALPAGFKDCNRNGIYGGEGYGANIWSSSEYNSLRGVYILLTNKDDNAFLRNALKDDGYSVRCLKDYPGF